MATKIVAIKKQKLKTVEKEEEFVLSNEWIIYKKDVSRNKESTVLKYKIETIKTGSRAMYVYFGQEVSDHTGMAKGERAQIAFHRDDKKRVLVFRSENGNSIYQPTPNLLYFYIKFTFHKDFFGNTPDMSFNVDPIYRKGRVVEFRLKD